MKTKEVFEKVLQNLGNSPEELRKMGYVDSNRSEDYMMYSPLPVGYNTTAEQRFLMQNY
jgi:hypothetical protein